MNEPGWTWSSCHVFHHGDPDAMLTALVLPLLDDLLDRGLVRRRFFLRHWERGPHVRVRVETRPADIAAVRAEIEARVVDHLARHPGPTDTDPERLAASLDRLSVLEHGPDAPPVLRRAEPPNTMRWIDYEPELAKYGGPDGIRIAEDVFDVSSLLAGQVLRLVPDDRARLGIALQLLLIASRSLGLDDDGRVVFCRSYQERWMGYLPDPPRLLAAWRHQYDQQRDQYAALVTDLVRGAPIGRGVGERWEQALDDAIGRLQPLVRAGRVWPADVDRAAPPLVAVAAIVCQYLHTTNNRMNVRPQGECFVAYLAHRAMSEFAAGSPITVDERKGAHHVG